MDALVMAGGAATRMGGVEKPIVTLAGRPLIDYVLDALLHSRSVGHIYVAVSPRVPRTAEHVASAYRTEKRISLLETPGCGYVEDTAEAARRLGLDRPFLVAAADIPFITPEVVDQAIARYEASGMEALSVRLDVSRVPRELKPDTILTDGDMRTVPAGVNIIDGRHMDRYQEETVLVVDDGHLAANVNYLKDLDACEEMVKNDRPHRQV